MTTWAQYGLMAVVQLRVCVFVHQSASYRKGCSLVFYLSNFWQLYKLFAAGWLPAQLAAINADA